VLVCGGREFADRDAVHRVLDAVLRKHKAVHVITGCATRGADGLAVAWAKDRNQTCDVYEADWGRYGDAAGPIRNAEMAMAGCPQAAIAFPGGKGTANMKRQLRNIGIEPWEPLGDARSKDQPSIRKDAT
jgi:hypothetical protein